MDMSVNAGAEEVLESQRAELAPLSERFRHGENPLDHLAAIMEALSHLDDTLFLAGAKLAFANLLHQRPEIFPVIRLKHVPVVAKESWTAILAVFDRAGSPAFFGEVGRVRAEVDEVLAAVAEIRSPQTLATSAMEPAQPRVDQMMAATMVRLADAADMFHAPSASAHPSHSPGALTVAAGAPADGFERVAGKLLERAVAAGN